MSRIIAKPQFRPRQVFLGTPSFPGGERDVGIAGLQRGSPKLVRLVLTNPLLVIHFWLVGDPDVGSVGGHHQLVLNRQLTHLPAREVHLSVQSALRTSMISKVKGKARVFVPRSEGAG